MSGSSPQAPWRRTTPSRRGRQASATKSASPGHYSYVSDTVADKPAPTFTSSLSIAVEGTAAAEKSSGIALGAASSSSSAQPPGEAKRAPRKSKTDALVALNRSRSPSLEETRQTPPERTAPSSVLNTVPISVPSTLDMSTVKTSTRRHFPPRSKTRLFELEECPTFHPSPEEFKDPLGYIRSISPQAQNYGIIKVVPPIGWKMPFVTDTEAYRFKTRAMRLNSIEASSRAKINFLEALYRFHKQQGNPRVTVPTINHKPLDLWSLRKEVQKLGGFESVNRGKKWTDLGRLLGYGGIPGLSTQLRNSYIRVILPYEHYSERVRNSAAFTPSKPRDTQTPPPIPVRSGSDGLGSPLNSPLSITSSPLSEPPDDGEINMLGESSTGSPRPRKVAVNGLVSTSSSTNGRMGNGSARAQSPDALPPVKDDGKGDHKPELTCCEICHKRNRGAEMLLCDGCDCGFHMFCLVPPLTTIPRGQWFCHTCLFGTGGDYGFDEGEEHSLSSFQARDEAFRKMWFQAHPPPQSKEPLTTEEVEDPRVSIVGNSRISEDDVESEFWRLVQSPYETVEIEYGADVHSTTHGSAMPTLETHPLDPYSKDAWNLNNIPILPDSLLRYIKSEISGMTVPWTYVGMIFSTFCWHNEDHYTHSINFMHWGETKTWYGIPGEDAKKFEAAIKKEAPELFETQPDLLFQLVTLMSPARLKESGVRVYACDQRAGEFVVTFPKAYHAGFNHGLNFNEAVNFALPDWLPLGRECVRRYQEHKKFPVFSHDELLITITQQSKSIRTAIWLDDSFKEMTDQEIQGRQAVRELGIHDILEERDHPEDQYQCSYCKAFCYLSQIICPCPKAGSARVVCLEHVKYLCDCPISQRALRLRFCDDELLSIRRTIANRAAIPGNWHDKLARLLRNNGKPQLRALRALMAEADRINYPLKELGAVRKCVLRGNDWIDLANSFLTRKQSRKRSKRFRWQPVLANGAGVSDDVTERPEKSLDELYAALDEVANLGFDTYEITLLRNLASQAEEFKAKARALLQPVPEDADRSSLLRECETLLAHGSSLNVHLEELYKIENIVLQNHLIKELEDVDDAGITLDEIRQYLTRAKACELPPDNKYMKLLESKLQAGNDWDERAANALTQPIKTIEELDQFFDVESSIPVDPAVLNRIQVTRARALEFEKQAKGWLSPEQDATLPSVQDALRLVQRAEKEFSIPAIHDLKRTADFAYDLEERCEAVLKNRYQHRDEGSVFDAMDKWRAYAREHLTKFRLPSFDKLNAELELHEAWIKKLPWYCPDHEYPHGREIQNDVVDYTKAADDTPPEDEFFTCICFDPVRPPPPGMASDAVQCDHCFARFHGRCAVNGGSCPFCDPNHWNGNIHNERNYHFCYLPTVLHNAPDITKNYSEYWEELKVIVQHIERLCAVIGHFLSFASQPGNQRAEYIPQVRHYMRKLFKIQFAVSPNPEVSFGLDLAGLHRILASRPAPVRMKKRRRPRFTFGQDIDKEWTDGTRCICRGQTPYLSGFILVKCDSCERKYHNACVCYRPSSEPGKPPFTCPLCCLRKAKPYRWADIRVRMHDETDPTIFVDVKACVETFSRSIVRIKLNPPVTPTIFVDLVHFTPGQPDSARAKPEPPSLPNGGHHTGRVPIHVIPQRILPQPSSASPSNVPPPPPWSRSESVSAGPSRSPAPTPTPAPAPAPAQMQTSETHLPLKRKRKHSSTDGRESVLVFEVDPQVPNTGSPSTHRGVHQSTSAELNIIMQDPSQMAAAQLAAQSRIKAAPPVHPPSLVLPVRAATTSAHHSPPQHPHSSTATQSPQQRPLVHTASHSPQQRQIVHTALHSPQQRPLMLAPPQSPQQRSPLGHVDPRSPQFPPPVRTTPHTPQQRPPSQSHSVTHSPQQRPLPYTAAHSPNVHSSPHRHHTHTTSPLLPPIHKAVGGSIPMGPSSSVHTPTVGSPLQDQQSPRAAGPSGSNSSVRNVKLLVWNVSPLNETLLTPDQNDSS
ncbi:hypothetical protein M0805_002435 [Coniferiporia weirii]|nr:hypothetical protein M0805_002435 [Coniferiporia weirii]